MTTGNDWLSEPNQKRINDAVSLFEENPSSGLGRIVSLANEGSIWCKLYLGWLYETGQFIEKDLQEARRWHLLAAESGLAQAQFLSSKFLLRNNEKDLARVLCERAALQDDTQAIGLLGRMHYFGCGGVKDLRTAEELLQRAYARDNIPAQILLGRLYMTNSLNPLTVARGIWMILTGGINILGVIRREGKASPKFM